MQRKFLRLLAGLAAVSFFTWSCNKIDTTQLGEDLIPVVDNVHTFADTLSVIAVREALKDDTIRLGRSESHALGNIYNDPVFGKTTADIFLQLKPTFFPFYFGNAKDTINPALNASTHFDSAFLCLSYTSFYGDTVKPQHLKVYQLSENTTNFVDTMAHFINFQPDQPYLGNFLGEATLSESELKNYTFLKTTLKDSVTKQIRIKLSTTFLQSLVKGDSTPTSTDNFFLSDSVFKQKFKGFAVIADGDNTANGLFYVSLTDPATRLEVFYVAANAGRLDTAFSSFPISLGTTLASLTASATANSIKRDSTIAEFKNNPDPTALYIQSAPGSAISLTIPSLASLSNRIIHRAELSVEQIPGGINDNVLTAPAYLYLDLIDTSATQKYKPLYYDLSSSEIYYPDNITGFFPTSGIDFNYYGGFLRSVTDGLGTRSFYTFNLTRYVQRLVTNGGTNYKFRVYAPYELSYNNLSFLYKNNLAAGRIKIGNGANADYRLRLRIVYSNL